MRVSGSQQTNYTRALSFFVMDEYDVCSWYISNYLMNYWREKEKKQITWLFPHHEKRENWITVFAVVPIFISLSQTQNCSSFSHVIHWVLGLHLIPSRRPRFLTFFLPTKEIKVAAVSFLKTRGNWILLNTRRYKKKERIEAGEGERRMTDPHPSLYTVRKNENH